VDYAGPAPDPPPFTTIAWRLVHLATCKVMYHEYAFSPGGLTWDELEIPHTNADGYPSTYSYAHMDANTNTHAHLGR